MSAFQLVLSKPYQFDLNLCHKSREKTTEFMNDNMVHVVCSLENKGVLKFSSRFVVSFGTTKEFRVVEDLLISRLTMVNQDVIDLIQVLSLQLC